MSKSGEIPSEEPKIRITPTGSVRFEPSSKNLQEGELQVIKGKVGRHRYVKLLQNIEETGIGIPEEDEKLTKGQSRIVHEVSDRIDEIAGAKKDSSPE